METTEKERKNPNCTPMLYGCISYQKRELLLEKLKSLLNKLGIDNEMNTQDFLLAEYILNCLIVYGNVVCKKREMDK